MNTRRDFIAIMPLAGLAALAACGDKAALPSAAPPSATAPAQTAAPAPTPRQEAAPTGAMVDPADATAVGLGYVQDAKTTRDAKYVAGSACANCALFGGKAGDTAGPCPLFAGKQVAATGWCTAFAKKA